MENSLQRESAIFEGDERFLAYDPYETIYLSKHRLVNKSWARKGDSNQIISETAISILNEINQYHRVTKPNANPMEIVDYYTAAKRVGMEHYIDKLPEIDSIYNHFNYPAKIYSVNLFRLDIASTDEQQN